MKKIVMSLIMIACILVSIGSSQACIERGELKKEYDIVEKVYYDKRDKVYYVDSKNWVLELSDKPYSEKLEKEYTKKWKGKKIVIYYWSYDDIKDWQEVGKN